MNGALWMSGTGKTRPIDIASMVIGKSGWYSNNYKGSIDEFRVWDKALTQTEIENWMNMTVDAGHPSYANLVAYYQMDEGSGTSFNDASTFAEIATGNGSGIWYFTRGNDLERFFAYQGVRPDLTIFDGTFDITVTPVNVLDSVLIVPNTVNEHAINSNPGVIMDDEIITTNTYQVWEANDQYVYDAVTGAIVDTIPVTDDSTIDIVDMEYLSLIHISEPTRPY